MNQTAFAEISAPKQLKIVPKASHLFTEPGTLQQAAQFAWDWFTQHLGHAGISD